MPTTDKRIEELYLITLKNGRRFTLSRAEIRSMISGLLTLELSLQAMEEGEGDRRETEANPRDTAGG